MDDRRELDALRHEVAALREELAAMRHRPTAGGPMTRRGLLMGLAGAGAAGVATLTGASPATAADGDALMLGEENAATTVTTLSTTTNQVPALEVSALDPDAGVPPSAVSNSHPALAATGSVTGVTGSGLFIGVLGRTIDGYALAGEAIGTGLAIRGLSVKGPTIRAASTDGVTLQLDAANRKGPPQAGTFAVGSISVDEDGTVWTCVAGGTPGTWTRLLREDTAPGRTVPIPPIRVLDTRASGGRPTGAPAVPGQVKGPLHGGQVVTLDLAGVAPIPATATGLVGNVNVVSPSAKGYVRLYPAGTEPATSTVNFPAGGITANAFLSALNPTGLSARAPISASTTYHLTIDVTAYIT